MSRVGIVTWYWGNYGSILQAYALQQAIQKMGYECEIIRHNVNGGLKTQIIYRISHEGVLSTIDYGLKKVLSKASERKYFNSIMLRESIFNNFINTNLKLSYLKYENKNYVNCLNYDVYVCGSDQIWNPSFTFFSPFYWLDFVPKNKAKIAYAPSMGSFSIKENDKKLIQLYLNDFISISVRESKSMYLLNSILQNKDIVTVSDPTILIDAETWKRVIPSRTIKERYLFAYIIRGDNDQRKYIEKIAYRANLKLVVYPFLERKYFEHNEESWGDIRCFEDNPFDFLEKINNADIVITDSFHCTVFSLLLHKNFYVMEKINDYTSQFTRLEHLLGICHKENRIINIDQDFVNINDDFEESDRAIEKIKIESNNFLKNSLEQADLFIKELYG